MSTLEANDGRAFVSINKAYTDALTSLGFDPVSRSRLGVAEVRAATSIDKLLEKRHNRAKAEEVILVEEYDILVEPETVIYENGETTNNETNSN
jgi:hypothetical protein